jgi:predicted MFS family arabinose efflux permease
MLASLAWGLLFLFDALRMWHAVAILTIHGAAGVLGAPAVQLIVHDMVGGAQLHSAVRLNATSRNLATLLGPAVGGGLMLALGPAWGLLANLLAYLPLTILLLRIPYTGHGSAAGAPRRAAGLGLEDAIRLWGEVRADRRLVTMIGLAGATSFFVGNAFQAQMPEYAQALGTDEAGARYSLLLAANAVGGVLGALALESVNVVRPSPRTVVAFAGIWGVTLGLFALTRSYGLALTLLVLAGIFNIAFTSMAQTLVQLLAPPRVRGRIVGLFNTAMLGLRAGSGVTVGVLGAAITVHWSLALSAAAVVLTAAALLARDLARPRPG